MNSDIFYLGLRVCKLSAGTQILTVQAMASKLCSQMSLYLSNIRIYKRVIFREVQ